MPEDFAYGPFLRHIFVVSAVISGHLCAWQVVYPPATERFARNVASKDVTIKPFDKFAHDIYLDTCKVGAAAINTDFHLDF